MSTNFDFYCCFLLSLSYLGEPHRLGSVQVQGSEQHGDGGGNRGAEK